jgi:hypothetical protein
MCVKFREKILENHRITVHRQGSWDVWLSDFMNHVDCWFIQSLCVHNTWIRMDTRRISAYLKCQQDQRSTDHDCHKNRTTSYIITLEISYTLDMRTSQSTVWCSDNDSKTESYREIQRNTSSAAPEMRSATLYKDMSKIKKRNRQRFWRKLWNCFQEKKSEGFVLNFSFEQEF